MIVASGWGRIGWISLQVLIWVVFYLLLLLYTSHKWDHPLFGLMNASISTLSYILVTYGHAYWLLPRFFYAGRRTQYVLFSVAFLVLAVVTRMVVEKAVLLPLHRQFYAFRWPHLSFTCITLLVAFLFGALLRVLFNYLKLVEVKIELQARQSETELALLKAQVQPHFLFNTLNNIYSLAQSRSEKTPATIARLSSLMRFFIDEAPRKTLLLETELQFIRDYIELEQIRMVHPVAVHWDLDAGIGSVQLPPMLLMPFAENVFKHGVDKLCADNWVRISLRCAHGRLEYRVENSCPDESATGGGSGLSNLEKRLALLYPGDHQLQTGREGNRYLAVLNIPAA